MHFFGIRFYPSFAVGLPAPLPTRALDPFSRPFRQQQQQQQASVCAPGECMRASGGASPPLCLLIVCVVVCVCFLHHITAPRLSSFDSSVLCGGPLFSSLCGPIGSGRAQRAVAQGPAGSPGADLPLSFPPLLAHCFLSPKNPIVVPSRFPSRSVCLYAYLCVPFSSSFWAGSAVQQAAAATHLHTYIKTPFWLPHTNTRTTTTTMTTENDGTKGTHTETHHIARSHTSAGSPRLP